MESTREDIKLVLPDVDRDAPFAVGWFDRPEGRQTLLSMGNAEHEIEPPTLDGEKSTLQEFIELEKDGRQITRMIVIDNKTTGAVWVELSENHRVKPPSLHIMIGDPDYRGRGIGLAVMKSAIKYVKDSLRQDIVYSRYLTSNQAIAGLSSKLGFEIDGPEYEDENSLKWQNIKLVIA